ncbi:Threonine/homoserine efflux transporter RhtA [Geodermatophilus telluris]|uniref:Threonine/homoserine efflux transporter RhtA n=1 Tax=Geodermatophilus telluris TaxID=1190417 RepID=A0A1G6RQU0_9ACTN|nr:DMT family transporter [Geodermatophilus telluris]SDD06316.1 Threonine/homoserine efflux transporter RhtA [Geodermatophilus telluris]
MTRSPAAAVLAAVVVTVLAWASAFIGIRAVGEDLSPGALALGRLLVGTAVLALLSLRRGWVAPTRREWGLLVLCGVAWFGVYNVALNAAERHLDAGTTAMLVNTGPILIAVLAGLVLGEGFPGRLVAGLTVAFAGVLLIGVAGRDGGTDLLGVVLCLLAAVTYAVGVVAQKPVLRRLPPLQVTVTACAVGAACCLPWSGALAAELAVAPASSVLGTVYLGVVPTALAFSTWAYALARVPAGRLGVTTYLVPPLVVLLSWLLLDEVPPALAVAGGAVCLAGVALARSRGRARPPATPAPSGAAAAAPVQGHAASGRAVGGTGVLPQR